MTCRARMRRAHRTTESRASSVRPAQTRRQSIVRGGGAPSASRSTAGPPLAAQLRAPTAARSLRRTGPAGALAGALAAARRRRAPAAAARPRRGGSRRRTELRAHSRAAAPRARRAAARAALRPRRARAPAAGPARRRSRRAPGSRSRSPSVPGSETGAAGRPRLISETAVCTITSAGVSGAAAPPRPRAAPPRSARPRRSSGVPGRLMLEPPPRSRSRACRAPTASKALAHRARLDHRALALGAVGLAERRLDPELARAPARSRRAGARRSRSRGYSSPRVEVDHLPVEAVADRAPHVLLDQPRRRVARTGSPASTSSIACATHATIRPASASDSGAVACTSQIRTSTVP